LESAASDDVRRPLQSYAIHETLNCSLPNYPNWVSFVACARFHRIQYLLILANGGRALDRVSCSAPSAGVGERSCGSGRAGGYSMAGSLPGKPTHERKRVSFYIPTALTGVRSTFLSRISGITYINLFSGQECYGIQDKLVL